jgi:hypothetical protein
MNKVNRIMDSQDLLRSIMSEAIGIYMAKEPKIRDQWRDLDWWQVFNHLKHEVGEIERSNSVDRQYHNLLDLVGQAAICAAWVREHRI